MTHQHAFGTESVVLPVPKAPPAVDHDDHHDHDHDDHHHDEPEGYTGPATLRPAVGDELIAPVHLVSRFDPLAGRTVWTGRVAAALPLRTEVVLITPHGSSRGEVTEQDVWGNSRVRGLDRPPFPVELLDSAGA
jgi:hypothetical protein